MVDILNLEIIMFKRLLLLANIINFNCFIYAIAPDAEAQLSQARTELTKLKSDLAECQDLYKSKSRLCNENLNKAKSLRIRLQESGLDSEKLDAQLKKLEAHEQKWLDYQDRVVRPLQKRILRLTQQIRIQQTLIEDLGSAAHQISSDVAKQPNLPMVAVPLVEAQPIQVIEQPLNVATPLKKGAKQRVVLARARVLVKLMPTVRQQGNTCLAHSIVNAAWLQYKGSLSYQTFHAKRLPLVLKLVKDNTSGEGLDQDNALVDEICIKKLHDIFGYAIHFNYLIPLNAAVCFVDGQAKISESDKPQAHDWMQRWSQGETPVYIINTQPNPTTGGGGLHYCVVKLTPDGLEIYDSALGLSTMQTASLTKGLNANRVVRGYVLRLSSLYKRWHKKYVSRSER